MDKSSPLSCLYFPGQGAQSLEMVAGVAHAPSFKERYGLVCELLNNDPIDVAKDNLAYLDLNLISSLLNVLVSSLSYELLEDQMVPAYLAGYSVGQWTALWAAKVITFKQLLELLVARVDCMNDCLSQQPSGMIAVIGLAEEVLTELCQTVQAQGYYLSISNYNAAGQFTLAGTEQALQIALKQLNKLNPKKYQRIPVAGAWHCALLKPAAVKFREYLENIVLRPPCYPVLDNVTAKFLPSETEALKDQLAAHLCLPVLWNAGIRFLIDNNCQRFIEVGHGKTLTKFGFFIDRSVDYQSFYNQFE